MEMRRLRCPDPTTATVAALGGLVGAAGLISADVLWTVPLGARIVHGDLPQSIPFATAPSSGWHNVPAGAELVLWALYHAFGGIRGLAVAQAIAAAIGFGALTWGLRREGAGGATLLLPVLVLVGSLSITVVIGVSLFSLALFPVLLALLESEARTPSDRVWLSVPLLAVWGNLHGEVLAGWGLLACYLIFSRSRREPLLAASVLAAATLALFANPALWQTPHYYWSVFHNEMARRGAGAWRPLGTGTLDLILVTTAGILIALSLARGIRIRPWEGVALVGLAVATIHIARTGPWFLFLAAYPAARSLRLRELQTRLLALTAFVLGVGAAAALVRGPLDPGSTSLARRAAATGLTVLAEGTLGGQVALAGGRVWVGDPIDAFRPADQRLYIDWLEGRPLGAPAVSHAAYVLVSPDSTAGRIAAHDPRLVRIAATSGGTLYLVAG